MKPLSQAEIIRKLLARHPSARPTVTIKQTMKGDVRVEVSVPDTTVAKAGAAAQAEFDRLRDRYALEAFISREAYDQAVEEGTPFD